MDLSREKIVFKASKRIFTTLVWRILCTGLGMLVMCDGASRFLDPQRSYHAENDLSIFVYGLTIVVYSLVKVKEAIVRQIYVTETGIIRRYGISGKWCRIDFDRIAAASLHTVSIQRAHYRELKIVCLNHQVMTIAGNYTTDSVDRVADTLENNNIPVYRSIEEAKQAAAGCVMKEPAPAEPINDPSNVYLHYGLVCLPLLVIVCLVVGGVLNSRCGTQKDIVTYGTVLSKAIVQEKNSSTGEIILRFGQKKDSFSVTPQFVSQLRVGDRVKAHYTRGCFGLDYGLTFKKL